MEKEINTIGYQLPGLDLLDEYIPESKLSDDEIDSKVEAIRNILESGKVHVKDIQPILGPAVTLYKVFPENSDKISKVRLLLEDSALGLRFKGVRVVTLEDSIGIEIANDHRETVPMRSVLNDDSFRERG